MNNNPNLFVSECGIGTEGVMPMKKLFLDDSNQAITACPNCFKSKTLSGTDYEEIEGRVKIRLKCACGASDAVILERRKSFRKDVDLPGVLISDPAGPEKPMTIQNLSVSGMRIRLSKTNGVRIGDKITVEFKAGPDGNSLIRKDAVIRNVEGHYIGVEFCRDSERSATPAIKSLIFS